MTSTCDSVSNSASGIEDSGVVSAPPVRGRSNRKLFGANLATVELLEQYDCALETNHVAYIIPYSRNQARDDLIPLNITDDQLLALDQELRVYVNQFTPVTTSLEPIPVIGNRTPEEIEKSNFNYGNAIDTSVNKLADLIEKAKDVFPTNFNTSTKDLTRADRVAALQGVFVEKKEEISIKSIANEIVDLDPIGANILNNIAGDEEFEVEALGGFNPEKPSETVDSLFAAIDSKNKTGIFNPSDEDQALVNPLDSNPYSSNWVTDDPSLLQFNESGNKFDSILDYSDCPIPDKVWQFMFNPSNLHETYGAKYSESKTFGVFKEAQIGVPLQWEKFENPVLKLSELKLHGVTFGRKVQRLKDGLVELMHNVNTPGTQEPTVVEFVWGKYRWGPAVIENLIMDTSTVTEGDAVNILIDEMTLKKIPRWQLNDGEDIVLKAPLNIIPQEVQFTESSPNTDESPTDSDPAEDPGDPADDGNADGDDNKPSAGARVDSPTSVGDVTTKIDLLITRLNTSETYLRYFSTLGNISGNTANDVLTIDSSTLDTVKRVDIRPDKSNKFFYKTEPFVYFKNNSKLRQKELYILTSDFKTGTSSEKIDGLIFEIPESPQVSSMLLAFSTNIITLQVKELKYKRIKSIDSETGEKTRERTPTNVISSNWEWKNKTALGQNPDFLNHLLSTDGANQDLELHSGTISSDRFDPIIFKISDSASSTRKLRNSPIIGNSPKIITQAGDFGNIFNRTGKNNKTLGKIIYRPQTANDFVFYTGDLIAQGAYDLVANTNIVPISMQFQTIKPSVFQLTGMVIPKNKIQRITSNETYGSEVRFKQVTPARARVISETLEGLDADVITSPGTVEIALTKGTNKLIFNALKRDVELILNNGNDN